MWFVTQLKYDKAVKERDNARELYDALQDKHRELVSDYQDLINQRDGLLIKTSSLTSQVEILSTRLANKP